MHCMPHVYDWCTFLSFTAVCMMILCNLLSKILLDLLNSIHPCSVIGMLLFASTDMHCSDNDSDMLSIPHRSSHRMKRNVVGFPIGIETNAAGPLMWMGKILQDYCNNVTEFDFFVHLNQQKGNLLAVSFKCKNLSVIYRVATFQEKPEMWEKSGNQKMVTESRRLL